MITATVPENDVLTAKQAVKEARQKNMEYMQEDMSPEEMACIVQCAHEIMADPKKWAKVKPIVDMKVKALKGLAGLKNKLNEAHMREMKKEC